MSIKCFKGLNGRFVRGRGYVTPSEVTLGDLVDVVKITSEARVLSSIIRSPVGAFGSVGARIVPLDPDSEGVIATSDLCAKLLGIPNTECMRMHKEIAMEATDAADPIVRTCPCGAGIIESLPIVLTYRGRSYPKGAFNIVLLERPPDLHYMQEQLDVSEESARQLIQCMDMFVLSPNLRQQIMQAVAAIALHVSQEITAAYATYRTNFKLLAARDSLHLEKKKLELYQTIVDNVNDFIFMADAKGRRLIVNRKVREELGYTENELLGPAAKSLHPEEDQRIARSIREEAVAKGSASGEIRLVAKDGSVIETELHLTYSEQDKTFQGIYRDITERRQMERDLQNNSKQLEMQNRTIVAAVQDRERFFANVSHELRTPMTSIIGFSELLLEDTEDPLTPGQRVQVDSIERNAHSMLMLVNDLLDLSKIESGRAGLNPEDVELRELVPQIVVNIRPLVRKKPVRIITQLPESLPKITTDEQKLSQILLNLLSNAIKFTDKGKIIVSARKEGKIVKISVADTGMGIDQSELGDVFKEFYQSKSALKSGRAGTGLGLAIVQKLAELLGGSVQVESERGKGSVFTVSLPIVMNGFRPTPIPDSESSPSDKNSL